MVTKTVKVKERKKNRPTTRSFSFLVFFLPFSSLSQRRGFRSPSLLIRTLSFFIHPFTFFDDKYIKLYQCGGIDRGTTLCRDSF